MLQVVRRETAQQTFSMTLCLQVYSWMTWVHIVADLAAGSGYVCAGRRPWDREGALSPGKEEDTLIEDRVWNAVLLDGRCDVEVLMRSLVHDTGGFP